MVCDHFILFLDPGVLTQRIMYTIVIDIVDYMPPVRFYSAPASVETGVSELSEKEMHYGRHL
jgi:hypothetical protein